MKRVRPWSPKRRTKSGMATKVRRYRNSWAIQRGDQMYYKGNWRSFEEYDAMKESELARSDK